MQLHQIHNRNIERIQCINFFKTNQVLLGYEKSEFIIAAVNQTANP